MKLWQHLSNKNYHHSNSSNTSNYHNNNSNSIFEYYPPSVMEDITFTSPWNHIPSEIFFFYIIPFLPVPYLCRLERVSSAFRQTLSPDGAAWRMAYEQSPYCSKYSSVRNQYKNNTTASSLSDSISTLPSNRYSNYKHTLVKQYRAGWRLGDYSNQVFEGENILPEIGGALSLRTQTESFHPSRYTLMSLARTTRGVCRGRHVFQVQLRGATSGCSVCVCTGNTPLDSQKWMIAQYYRDGSIGRQSQDILIRSRPRRNHILNGSIVRIEFDVDGIQSNESMSTEEYNPNTQPSQDCATAKFYVDDEFTIEFWIPKYPFLVLAATRFHFGVQVMVRPGPQSNSTFTVIENE